MTGNPAQHLKGFGELKDDGSTTCASWIYCGCYPAPDQNMTARREPDPPGVPGAHLKWGWAWPANRDRKSTRLNSSHTVISYAVFCLKKKKNSENNDSTE